MVEAEGWKSTRLGRGAFGMVTLYENEKNSVKIVIKEAIETNMSERIKERWSLECEKILQLNHPNIVKGLEVPESLSHLNNHNCPVLAMEFCNVGDLRKKINKSINIYGFEEYQVKLIAHDVTEAIMYLHTNKIFHRDLKPENILMNRKPGERIIYKITDLGYAKEISDSCNCYSFVGTPQYLAPELLTDRSYDGKVDFWSLAITLFETTTGFRPFAPTEYKDNLKEVISKKQERDIYVFMEGNELRFNHLLPLSNRLSFETKTLLEQWFRLMLRFEPIKRGGTFNHESGTFECFDLLDQILCTKHALVYNAQSLSWNHYHHTQDNNLTNNIKKYWDEFTFIIDKNGCRVEDGFEKFTFRTCYEMSMSTDHENLILYTFHCNKKKFHKQDSISNPFLKALKMKAFDRVYKCQSNCSKFLTYHTYEAAKGIEKQSKALLALCAFFEREKDKLPLYKGKLEGMRCYVEDLFNSFDKMKNTIFNVETYCQDPQDYTEEINMRKWAILEQNEKADQYIVWATEQKSLVDNRDLQSLIDGHINTMKKHYDNASKIENEVKRYGQAANNRTDLLELMAQCLSECDRDNENILNFYLTKMNSILSFTNSLQQLGQLLEELRRNLKDFIEYKDVVFISILSNIPEETDIDYKSNSDSKNSINDDENDQIDNNISTSSTSSNRKNKINKNNKNNNNNNNNNDDRSITHELCLQSLNLIRKVENLLEIDTEQMAALNI